MRRLTLLLLPAALFAAQSRYARLGEFQGKVEVQLRAPETWMAAERNLPLMESSWVRTGPGSRMEIELDEGSTWRIGANSQFEISDYTRLSTGQRITMLSLDRGVGYFTGQSEGADSLMLAVPGAQVTVSRGARVRLEVQDQWSQIAVIEGTVRFSSPAAEMDLREGQTTRVEPANPARFFIHREVSPMDLDGWSEERDKALSTSTSAAHVIQRYGVVDLDSAGEWIQTEELGAVWKPKAQDGWMPFQNGRWRWYDALGYTWVGDEPWGWLPYHHGRWLRKENVGWVWAPARSSVFKPGDVFWMRGNRLAGWGPLGPGELWPASAPENAQPQQYAAPHTVWAAFEPEAMLLDPNGFTARPKDPLLVAAFTVALPSPALPAAKLDAVRPLNRAGRGRVTPILEGVSYGGSATIPTEVPLPPPPVTDPGPPPAPPTATVAYPPPPPVIVPLPNILIVNSPANPDYIPRPRAQGSGRPSAPANTTTQTSANKPAAPATPPAAATTTPAGRTISHAPPKVSLPDVSADPPKHPLPSTPAGRPASLPPAAPATAPSPDGRVNKTGERPSVEKKFRDSAEQKLLNNVVEDLGNHDYNHALTNLDSWTRHYRDSEYADERAYYYMQAYSSLNQPAKAVDTGATLIVKGLDKVFTDPVEIVGVLYLESLNYQKLPSPTRDQSASARAAGYELLKRLPSCFVPQNKPAATTTAEWTKARSDLEVLARQTIATVETRATAFR